MMSSSVAAPARIMWAGIWPDRRALLAGVIVLGAVNGLSEPIWRSIAANGFGLALLGTFDVSAFVWLALAAAPALLLRGEPSPTQRSDFAVAGVAGLLALLPLAPASWIGQTIFGLYLVWPARKRDRRDRRAGLVLLATANALFWGRLLLHGSGDVLLNADAGLVALLTGMPHSGNVIRTAGTGGYLWIAPYCSSLTNISLALLFGVLVVQWRGVSWTTGHTLRCAAAGLSVIVINDLRIASMVLRPDLYFMVHGPAGSLVGNVLSTCAILVCILAGTDGDRAPHR